jgi:Calcineurin-like phosphoesterase
MILRPILRRTATAAAFIALFAAIPQADAPRAPQRQPSGRVVVIGDIHGSIDGLTGILRTAGLSDGRVWTGGNATLVQTGDYTDRGTAVRAVMDLLMALEPQAAAAGGRVQVLLGNHEVMNLVGETRDVTPAIFATFAGDKSEARHEEAWREYEKFFAARAARLGAAAGKPQAREAWMTAHPPGFFEYREAFGPEGTYGKWLRRLPVVAQIDGSIMMHAGIHPDTAPDSIEDINKQVARELRNFDDYSRHLVSRGVILPFFTLQEIFDAVQAEAQAITAAQTAAKNGESASLAQSQILSDVDRKHIEVLQGIARFGTWSLLNPNGPLWFRGYATWPSPGNAPEVTKLLKKYNAKRFVTGHTVPSTMRITPRFDRRIFLIDTGMLSTYYKGGRASALEIDGDRVTAIYQDGRVQLDPESAQPENDEFRMPNAERPMPNAEGLAVNR